MKLSEDKTGLDVGYSVCSMVRLGGFGEETVSATVGSYVKNNPALPFEVWCDQLRKLIFDWDKKYAEARFKWDLWNSKFFPKLAFCYAVTASTQKVTMTYLRELGFNESQPYSKLKHPDSTLTLWHISCDELCKKLGYVSEYDPRSVEERGY